jgi:type I restriction enzyme S subunit
MIAMSKPTDAMQLLEKHFDTAFAAPDGIKKLRELILTLAMQGKLVPQDPNDPPASELLKKIEAEKKRLVKAGKIKAQNPLSEIKPEEVPYELPKGWDIVTLGNATTLITKGATPTTYGYSFQKGGIPFVKVENVKSSSIQFTDKMQFISDEAHKFQKRSQLESEDILFSIAGTIGETCLVKSIDLPANINQALAIIRGYGHVFLPSFLIRALNSVVADRIKSRARGAAMNNISLGDIKDMIIPLPPLAEQHRIVAKIDQLMVRCDELEKLRADHDQKRIAAHTAALIRLLTATESETFSAWDFVTQNFGKLYSVKENVADLRKAILQLAVMGKLVPQYQNDQPASELLKEIEAEKKRLVKAGKIKAQNPLPEIKSEEVPYELPTGWEWVRLGEIGFWKSGTTPSRANSAYYGGSIPWVKSGEVKQGRISSTEESITEKALNECSLNINPVGAVLIAMYGANIGDVGVLEIDATTNQAVCACTTYSSVDKLFLSNLLRSMKPSFIEQGAGAAQPNISREKIINTIVPLPPPAEQCRIVTKIDQLMALCDELEKQIDATTSTQTALLNAVMAQV